MMARAGRGWKGAGEMADGGVRGVVRGGGV